MFDDYRITETQVKTRTSFTIKAGIALSSLSFSVFLALASITSQFKISVGGDAGCSNENVSCVFSPIKDTKINALKICRDGQSELCYTGSIWTRNRGICRDGLRICINGSWNSCSGQIIPFIETCDSGFQDEDCDGIANELCQCINGQIQPCYTGPIGTANVGICRSGISTCFGGIWGVCTGLVLPRSEVCDQLDNDCDGFIDDSCR